MIKAIMDSSFDLQLACCGKMNMSEQNYIRKEYFMKKEEFVKRLIITIVGLMVVGMGVGLTIYSGLGVDPGSVLGAGVANVFSISVGQGFAIMNVSILLLALVVDRKWVSYGTFIGAILTGYLADFFMGILGSLFPNLGSFGNVVLSVMGTLILAVGVAIYTSAQLGISSLDIPPEIISEKFKLPYGRVRMFVDGFYVITGYLLGGPIGLGTILGVLLIGPIVQRIRPGIKRGLNIPDSFD